MASQLLGASAATDLGLTSSPQGEREETEEERRKRLGLSPLRDENNQLVRTPDYRQDVPKHSAAVLSLFGDLYARS